MFSFSLGGLKPAPPRTNRGKIVNPAIADAVPATKSLREMPLPFLNQPFSFFTASNLLDKAD